MATPYVTIVRDVVASTQDLAAASLAESNGPVLVMAAEQTSGRGRSGNEWWQADRAVAASLAFSSSTMGVKETFPLAVGMAVRTAIADVLGVTVDLKWPNDLERSGRKVGGVLVEQDQDRVVAGCGLNLFWSSPPETAGGLVDADPGPQVGEAISEAWAATVLGSGGTWDRDGYLAACSTIGKELTWQPAGKGRAVSVDERGGLVVATGLEQTTLRSGVVQTIRPAHKRDR